MTIQSSSFVIDAAPQRDGRYWITETHIDGVAGPLKYSYLAPDATNATAVMNARVPQINEMLKQAEFDSQVANYAPGLVLQQQTFLEFGQRFHALYKVSTAVECARLGKWFMDHFDNADFTAAQVQSAFGISSAQWTSIKTLMTNQRTAYNTCLAAAGA